MQQHEVRRDLRFDTILPVQLEEAQAVTQNVSRGGVYFECDTPQKLGELVTFSVEYTVGGEKHRLSCEGQVVRVEQRGSGRYGVATRLVTPFFAGTA